MASDYKAILDENKKRYGTDIGRIGPMLLADRYADRTHFIFELLQNAEDALARRKGWTGKRSVDFSLTKTTLRVSHYGIPFTKADVQGICGIAASTKGQTEIGRFGIGFKSVYAFTDCPEIHSGDEHFSIDCFVWPKAITENESNLEKTTFILPLRETDITAYDEIADGLSKLGARTLLFLREIEEISWTVEDGSSGIYLRDKPIPFGNNGRKITVLGQEQASSNITEETWLVFSREVKTENDINVGYVEIALSLDKDDEKKSFTIVPISDSTLVVFFPTIVPTNLGLLVQGPYRTTPSRDNIPRNDPWNQHLVKETSLLLVDTLKTLRDNKLLNVSALSSLPLDRSKFPEGNMFVPFFETVQNILATEPLLPCFGGGYTYARTARLGRTQDIRELIDSNQLANILDADADIFWLSEEITRDKMAELRRYLMQELGIVEITPEMLIQKLNKSFLESQSDVWVIRLYDFLNGQPARQRQLDDIPIVRLEDGSHVTAKVNGKAQAFLPGLITTGFPTVRNSICASAEARKFLESIGLSEPDPVDDVIRNVLPKYVTATLSVNDTDYSADINRILQAFATDSKVQREKLINALRETNFVKAVDAGKRTKVLKKPSDIYLATQRLKELFEDVNNVLLVDDSHTCLKGENVRELLEACGATRYLQPIPFANRFTWAEEREMRRRGGCEDCTYNQGIEDYTLRGLADLLASMTRLNAEKAKQKASLLWEALHDVEDRRGTTIFTATYRWKYFWVRSYEFDAAFVRILNETPWIPNNAKLDKPCYVLFEDTNWKQHPFLLSKIKFKPPIIETLAREAGFEPGVLDLLKKLGVTSEDELKKRLGIQDHPKLASGDAIDGSSSPDEALRKLGIPGATKPAIDDDSASLAESSGASSSSSGGAKSSARTGAGNNGGSSNAHGDKGKGRPSVSKDARTFVSYIAVHSDDDDSDPDPDGLAHEERMALEDRAITMIIRNEPQLERMPANNPGFDLIERNSVGATLRWIEVKAMKSDLSMRPVGLSHVQFECAREHGIYYWLYVVENTDTESEVRIVRIQDPAGKARTFTFDYGWRNVAEVTEPCGLTNEEDVKSDENEIEKK